jgi:hypothetical protein
MPWMFLLNGTFTMLTFLLKTFFNSMHWCKSATLKIANLAILNHYMVLLNHYINFKFFLEVNVFIWSTMKVPFNKNVHDMSQCPPNPGFRSIKVQNVDFLKKPSVDNIFFFFPYVLLSYYHHLKAEFGMYIALCIFLKFWQVWMQYLFGQLASSILFINISQPHKSIKISNY